MAKTMTDLRRFTGMSDLDGNFDNFYRTAVNKLGGPEQLKHYIPFDMETLRKSYQEDEHFNTTLTPMKKWDMATGIQVQQDQVVREAVATGGGIWPLLNRHGINWMSQSQGVCLLKTAARMLVEKG